MRYGRPVASTRDRAQSNQPKVSDARTPSAKSTSPNLAIVPPTVTEDARFVCAEWHANRSRKTARLVWRSP